MSWCSKNIPPSATSSTSGSTACSFPTTWTQRRSTTPSSGTSPITRAAFCRSLIDVADTDPAGAEPAEVELEGYRHWRDAEGGVFALRLAETIDAVQANLTGQTYPAWIDDSVALALRTLGPGVDFEMGLDRRSLVWLEGYLQRGRNTRGFDAQGLVPVLGSFLGQCLVEHGRGTWLEDENGWLVRLPGIDARPFDKVDKVDSNKSAASRWSASTTSYSSCQSSTTSWADKEWTAAG